MPVLDKSTAMADAVAQIPDGARIMIGGFGVPGTPFLLIEELVRQGPKKLTIIKNDANEADMGVDRLLAAGMVQRLITSHIGLNSNAIRMMNAGELEVEFVAQGILAERIRTAGAGLKGFVSDIGMGTLLAEGKQRVEVDGHTYLFEPAIEADFALVHAARADLGGNLVYEATARNFNPLMAMAAECTIAEAETIVPIGSIEPDTVHTPAPFVDHLVALTELTEVYGVVKR
ncbi:CoA transferase subunit A [Hoeflea sp.]|uniref:CoA transferase subunit A n=1 Tax=Hoeflea sp. TaxID=1940281 RepID=UPI003A8F0F39